MLSIFHYPHEIMEGIIKVYDLKRDPETKKTYYEPRRYFGSNVGKFYLPDGIGTA